MKWRAQWCRGKGSATNTLLGIKHRIVPIWPQFTNIHAIDVFQTGIMEYREIHERFDLAGTRYRMACLLGSPGTWRWDSSRCWSSRRVCSLSCIPRLRFVETMSIPHLPCQRSGFWLCSSCTCCQTIRKSGEYACRDFNRAPWTWWWTKPSWTNPWAQTYRT